MCILLLKQLQLITLGFSLQATFDFAGRHVYLCYLFWLQLLQLQCLRGSGTMIAIGDETCKVVVTVKLYYKPASQLIITAVSINLAFRMLTL